MFNIRNANKEDAPHILRLVKELALFEKAPEQVSNTVEEIIEDGFPESGRPYFDCLIGEEGDEVVGIALFYIAYSTWKGRILYLDDLIITESKRGKGYGKALLESVLEEARKRAVREVRWQVLDWNEPAIEFYKTIGATLDGEWINCKVNFEG